MNHLVSKITNITIAVIVAVFSVNIMGAMSVSASHNPGHTPGGNNGTLKVHEKGTPSNSESTDPKVCIFNFEGFDLDPNQTGNITIDAIPPSAPASGVLVVSLSTNASGNGSTTPYINDVGGPVLPNGHYVATLDNKFGTDPGNKAKSKTFKVECPGIPTASIQAGPCVAPGESTGTASGTVTNTDDVTNASVTYTVTATHQVTAAVQSVDILVADAAVGNFNFTGLAAGTYDLTITGSDGTSAAPTTFTIATCNVPVTPAPATHVELCGTLNDKYTIPSTTGVTYLVNNVPTVAGTYNGTGTVTVTAVANMGYVLQGDTEWVFNFSATACDIVVTPAAPESEEKCGTKNDTYTVIATEGVKYMVGNSEVTGEQAGTGSVTITAVALPGYVLAQNAVASWTFEFSDEECKIDICHRTDSYKNPYNKINVALSAVDGVGEGDHYLEHQGPIFYPAIPKDTKWGDIIPPTTAFPLGLNWTELGMAIFNTRDCDVELVETTPEAPTADDICATDGDTYTIPSTPGVIYMVDGEEIAAGDDYPANGSEVVVTAVAAEGYILSEDATTEWTLEFTDEDCPAPSISATAVCTREGVLVTLTNAGNADGTVYVNGEAVEVPAESEVEVTVPFDALVFTADVVVELDDEETVLINKSFDCVPGQGGVPTPGVIVTPAGVPLAPATGLPRTGASESFAQLIAMITLAITAYGASFYLMNRRKLSDN